MNNVCTNIVRLDMTYKKLRYYSGNYERAFVNSFPNFTEFVIHSAAPNRLNQGMIYRLHLYPPEQQLAFMDQVASVGFKVIYEMPQMDHCNGSATPDQETSFSLSDSIY